MSSSFKKKMKSIKVPYLPISDFNASEFSERFSNVPPEENKESTEIMPNLMDCNGDELSENIVLILLGIGMEKYIDLFRKEAITFDTFLRLNDSDLQEIGITDPKDREIFVRNLSYHQVNKNEFIPHENPTDDLKIIKNVALHLLLLQNYCSYVELQMKKQKLTDYNVSSEESACMYLRAFIESALVQSQILCSRIYDEYGSDSLIDKLLEINNLTLPKALEELLPKKKKKKPEVFKIVAAIGFFSLIIVMGRYLVRGTLQK